MGVSRKILLRGNLLVWMVEPGPLRLTLGRIVFLFRKEVFDTEVKWDREPFNELSLEGLGDKLRKVREALGKSSEADPSASKPPAVWCRNKERCSARYQGESLIPLLQELQD